MTAPSKDAAPAGSKDNEKKLKEMLSIIGPSAFLTVISGAMLYSARQAVAIKQFKNTADLTTFLATLASAGAVFEFLVNPIFGKLADTHGRWAVMPLANIAIIIVRTVLYLKPTKKWPIVLEEVIGIPMMTSFFTAYRAAIADVLEGEAFSKFNALMGIPIGLSVIAGPLIAKLIMTRSDPVNCYLLSVAFNIGSLTNLCLRFKETLPVEKRKPLVLNDMQPLSFLQLMKKSSVLNRLMLVTGMQTFSEGRNVTDFYSIFLQSDLGWTFAEINNFVATFGIALVVGGLTVKSMMSKLGMRSFTTFCNTFNALSFSAMAISPHSIFPSTALVYFSILLGIPGGRKRDAVESFTMKIGSEAGFGNGFISGAMMNFRAVVNIVGPLLFGYIYRLGAKKKYPGAIFLGAAATVVLAEMIHLTISNDELGLDKRGQNRQQDSRSPSASSRTREEAVKVLH